MSRWTSSLREVKYEERRAHLRNALGALNLALAAEGLSDYETLHHVKAAAAEVRAWRKNLSEQGKRVKKVGDDDRQDRDFLWMAMHNLLNADEDTAIHDAAGTAYCLRWTEAQLRVLGLRLLDRIEANDGR